MKVPILDRVLSAERTRRKMSDDGLVNPVVVRTDAPEEEAPWVVSKTTGEYTLTRRDRDGCVAQAFFPCSIEEEDLCLRALYRTLWDLGEKHGWANRHSSIEQATRRMAANGLDVKGVVVPYSLVNEVCGTSLSSEDTDKVMLARGCVVEVAGARVYSAREALPDGAAMLVTSPAIAGQYIRIHDYLSISVSRADRSIVLVGDGKMD